MCKVCAALCVPASSRRRGSQAEEGDTLPNERERPVRFVVGNCDDNVSRTGDEERLLPNISPKG